MAIHLTEQARQDVTIGKGTIYLDSDTGELNVAGRTTPHIIPGVLYPAVSGKLIDGTITHGTGTYNGVSVSTNYGTTQSDGRKYYYTDIKGSKPIKDPRIGGHFGSQRHTFSSLQKLEQETATHGKDVYSVDGREWLRVVNNVPSAIRPWNDGHGSSLYLEGTIANASNTFIEIVGYFNDINFNVRTTANRVDDIDAYVNGGAATAVNDIGGRTTNSSPLQSRYVRAGSSINIGSTVSALLGNTPQINTLKIVYTNVGSEYGHFFSIELIAQDTSSTANRSKIQIPSQNVVSYGKKFTVSGTPHYDPFSAKTDGSAWTSPTSGTNNANSSASWPTNIDTSTSLGLDKWVDGSNYYRPYNGGRVVQWVDSSGTIKTSVTVMPPNAKSIKSADVNKKAKNAPNDTYLPTFEDETTDINEDNLHEVAKTFHFREFGNGSVNGGTGATYADASMLNTADNISYVMDDGLTSVSGNDVRVDSYTEMGGNLADSGDYWYMTFIGTGITTTIKTNNPGPTMYCQNLPFGSHIIKVARSSSADPAATTTIDGVSLGDVGNNYGFFSEVSFYQPKRPPIPEDACVLADYMLMADWVNSDSGAIGTIPKGAREVSPSRDLFYDSDGSLEHFYSGNYSSGWFFGDAGTEATINTNFAELPVFGTRFHVIGYDMDTRSDLYVDGSIATSSGTTGGNHSTYLRLTNPESNLGIHKFRVANKANGRVTFGNFFVDSPIHTSSHYQSFETPFLHELVGGDRNMEQHNLVCSPDGKTWDQITRDTSYIGNGVLNLNGIDGDPSDSDRDHETNGTRLVFLDCRGALQTHNNLYNKDFAIGYDRYICLKDGQYRVAIFTLASANNQGGDHGVIRLNNQVVARGHTGNSGYGNTYCSWEGQINRGDYISIHGRWHSSDTYSGFTITRI